VLSPSELAQWYENRTRFGRGLPWKVDVSRTDEPSAKPKIEAETQQRIAICYLERELPVRSSLTVFKSAAI
jgi:hypothetical protein